MFCEQLWFADYYAFAIQEASIVIATLMRHSESGAAA